MRIPFPPVGGRFTCMPAPPWGVGFTPLLRICLICVLLKSMSTPVLFFIARCIFLICLAVKCKVSLPRVMASFLNLSVTASPDPKARARLTFCPSESVILCG